MGRTTILLILRQKVSVELAQWYLHCTLPEGCTMQAKFPVLQSQWKRVNPLGYGSLGCKKANISASWSKLML